MASKRGSFHIGRGDFQTSWSKDVPPVLTVEPGQPVTFDLVECTGGQLSASSSSADIRQLKLERCNPIFGPVHVSGAEPGDVLEVEFLDLKPGPWGFTAVIPGFGLLSDEFEEPELKTYQIDREIGYIVFKEGIHVPIQPFLGVAGVAPGESGRFSTIPPTETGGNLDCRHLTTGAKLYLPVKVPGAKFSCGDGHAAQGDGEVCGSAIEVDMQAKIKFQVHKNWQHITSPHFDTSGCKREQTWEDAGSYATMGIDSDLREASRRAVRALIDHLVAVKGLTRVEAYMLASVAADLRFAEVVDMPNYAIAASIPWSIFSK